MFDDYDARLQQAPENFGRNTLTGFGNEIIEIYGTGTVSGADGQSQCVQFTDFTGRGTLPSGANRGEPDSELATQGNI